MYILEELSFKVLQSKGKRAFKLLFVSGDSPMDNVHH
jgi:hypothetical protein